MNRKLSLDAAIDFIEAEVSTVWAKLQAIYSCGDKPKITFETKKSKVAGFAYYDTSKGVKFNLAYFCSHESKKDLAETIAHELCHIVQFRVFPSEKQAHGPAFKFIMNSIGYSGNTYHYMNVKAAKNIVDIIGEDIKVTANDF